jgi:hypothetical protein
LHLRLRDPVGGRTSDDGPAGGCALQVACRRRHERRITATWLRRKICCQQAAATWDPDVMQSELTQERELSPGNGPSRHIALPHALARYRSQADVVPVESTAGFIGTRPSRDEPNHWPCRREGHFFPRPAAIQCSDSYPARNGGRANQFRTTARRPVSPPHSR